MNGCVLVVSYGVDGIDMWKERLDGTWENGTNGSVEKDWWMNGELVGCREYTIGWNRDR